MEPDPLPQYAPPPIPPRRPSTWQTLKKYLAPIVVVGALLFKFKSVLFAALKSIKFLPVLLKTGGSMFITIWAYSMLYGWRLAVGFVLLIFVHECGHLLAARRIGLKVGAPVFIPFMGAFIALKEAPKNAWIESQVGIGGPLLGTLGAVVCWGIYALTSQPIWAALAYIGFFLNLFNLAPVGFLDGGRIVTALSPWLWLVGIVIIGALLVMRFNFLILFIFLFSLPRVWSLFRAKTDEERRYFEVTPSQRWTMGLMYFLLIAFLVLGMELVRIEPPR